MFIRKIIDIVGNSKKSFAWYTFLVYDLEFTTPCWSATSSLLHLNQFRGGGKAPLPPPLNTPMPNDPLFKRSHCRKHYVLYFETKML